MISIKFNWIFFLLAIFLFGCSITETKDRRSLVDVEFIQKKINKAQVIQIIDIRTEEEYLHSHIPGARNVWRPDIQDFNNEIEGMAIKKDALKALMEGLGINSNDSLFLYDAKGNVDAARLWWILNLYGYEKVALIDGGFIQWRMKGYSESEGFEEYESSNFQFSGKAHPELLVKKAALMANEFDQIIDVRSAEEFTGEITKNGAFRGGHIPEAVHFDYFEMLNGGAFTFKSKEAILSLMKEKGLNPNKKTLTYCHSGVRSSLALFVLKEIAGMEKISNYDGSWIEWSEDEALQIEL